MREIVANLGLSAPVVAVGHDIGAMIAFAWAARYPDDIAALVLLDSLLPGIDLERGMDVAKGGSWHFGFFMTPGIPEMLLDGHEDEFISTMFAQLGGPDMFSEQDFKHYADAYRGRQRLRGGFEQYRALLADGAENAAMLAQRRLAMPVLDIVAGSPGPGAAHWTRLREHATDLTVLAAPSGHFVAEENPRWLVGQLRRFLGIAP